jgi:hypothetical protein
MRTIQPREVDAVPSANFQFLSSSGITQGSNSTLLILITDLMFVICKFCRHGPACPGPLAWQGTVLPY